MEGHGRYFYHNSDYHVICMADGEIRKREISCKKALHCWHLSVPAVLFCMRPHLNLTYVWFIIVGARMCGAIRVSYKVKRGDKNG